jgi:hypothetical protein
MVSASKFLFPIFYLLSGVAIAHGRTVLLLTEWEHASARDEQSQFEDTCKPLTDGHAPYQETERAGLNFDYRKPPAMNFDLQVSIRKFVCFPGRLKSSLITRTLASRAPPPHT